MITLLVGLVWAQEKTEEEVLLDVQQIQQEQVVIQAQSVTAKVTSIEAKLNWLADHAQCAQGLCPEGWVQPSVEEYAKPGAPSSFIPAEPEPEADTPPGTGPLLEVPEEDLTEEEGILLGIE